MPFTPVNVVRSYRRFREPAQGWVSMRPAVSMVNGDTVVSAATTAYLDAAGDLLLPVLAGDDPGTEPQGVAYEVSELIRGAPPRTYSVFISRTDGVMIDGVRTVDLATLDELAEPPALAAPLRLIRAAADLDLTAADVGRAIVITSLDPLTFGFATVGSAPVDDTFPSTFAPAF